MVEADLATLRQRSNRTALRRTLTRCGCDCDDWQAVSVADRQLSRSEVEQVVGVAAARQLEAEGPPPGADAEQAQQAAASGQDREGTGEGACAQPDAAMRERCSSAAPAAADAPVVDAPCGSQRAEAADDQPSDMHMDEAALGTAVARKGSTAAPAAADAAAAAAEPTRPPWTLRAEHIMAAADAVRKAAEEAAAQPERGALRDLAADQYEKQLLSEVGDLLAVLLRGAALPHAGCPSGSLAFHPWPSPSTPPPFAPGHPPRGDQRGLRRHRGAGGGEEHAARGAHQAWGLQGGRPLLGGTGGAALWLQGGLRRGQGKLWRLDASWAAPLQPRTELPSLLPARPPAPPPPTPHPHPHPRCWAGCHPAAAATRALHARIPHQAHQGCVRTTLSPRTHLCFPTPSITTTAATYPRLARTLPAAPQAYCCLGPRAPARRCWLRRLPARAARTSSTAT
jgi:hypothetical protein